MTVSTSYAPAILSADGTADEVALPWQFFEPSDVVVTRIKNGVSTKLELSRDYAVIGGKDVKGIAQIGTVKMAWVPEAGTEIRAERHTPKIQIENYDRRVEAALDRVMLITQEAIRTHTERVVVQEGAAPAAAPPVDLAPLLARMADLEARPVTVSVPVAADGTDYEPFITKLQDSAIAQERAMQQFLTLAEDLHRRVATLEDMLRALTDNAAHTLNQKSNAA